VSTRHGPELQGVYHNELERVIHEDAFECAWRAGLYKFGRLSNRRIVELIRTTAQHHGIALNASDSEILDRWFEQYSGYFHYLKSRRPSRLERSAS
jgi:hypothetical protein